MIPESKVVEGLREIFAEVFLRDDIPVSPGLTAKDVEGWDSFKQVEIIMATEQHFGMRFLSSEVDGFQTLGDLIKAVAQRAV